MAGPDVEARELGLTVPGIADLGEFARRPRGRPPVNWEFWPLSRQVTSSTINDTNDSVPLMGI